MRPIGTVGPPPEYVIVIGKESREFAIPDGFLETWRKFTSRVRLQHRWMIPRWRVRNVRARLEIMIRNTQRP